MTMDNKEFEAVCRKLQQCRRQIRPRSIPEIFGIQYKEVYITQWVGYLLDPSKNGVGIGPLNAMLRAGGYDEICEGVDSKDIKVYTEYVFDDSRRIDIFIDTPLYLIGIENKIWSEEQADQTKDYYKSLEKIAHGRKKVCGIYLYPEQNQKADPVAEFHLVTYRQFHDELKKATADYPASLDRWLIEDFLRYTEEDLMTKYPEISDIAQTYMNYFLTIETARGEFERYKKGVEKWIEDDLAANGYSTFGKGRNWHAIVENEKWNDMRFHYELLFEGDSLATAKSATAVIHLEPQDNSVVKFFEEKSAMELESFKGRSTYTLCEKKNIPCDFENEEKARDTMSRIYEVFRSEEFKFWKDIAEKYCK